MTNSQTSDKSFVEMELAMKEVEGVLAGVQGSAGLSAVRFCAVGGESFEAIASVSRSARN